jgi:hypothetical protein
MDTHDDQPDVAQAAPAAAPAISEHVFPLSSPVVFGGMTVSAIRIPKQLLGKHLVGAPSLQTAGEMDLMMHVLSRAAEVPIDVVHQVAIADLMPMFQVLGGQLGNVSRTPTG